MKTTFTKAGDFVRAVEAKAIAAVPGSYQVQFSSRLGSSRNPQEWQKNFALTVNKEDLETLRDVFSAALAMRA
jgi:hypothetical protein